MSEYYTFELSEKVNRKPVSYNNRYGICIAADLPEMSLHRIFLLKISAPGLIFSGHCHLRTEKRSEQSEFAEAADLLCLQHRWISTFTTE